MKTLIHQHLAGYIRLSLLGVLALGIIIAAAIGYSRAKAQSPVEAVLAVSTPSPQSSTLPSPSPTPAPLPESFSLPPVRWIGQTYNNCGPATVAEVLQYFGFEVSQDATKARLRSGSDDKNVTLAEISAYLREDFQLESKVQINGDLETLKRLFAAGIPVVVENWLHPNEDIGHVLLLRGYDDTQGVLIGDDVYLGPGHLYPYAEFDQTQWQPFNRIYLPVYRPEQEEIVRIIVGAEWDESIMLRRALADLQRETERQPDNVYSWFNLGEVALTLGQTELAQAALERSRSLGWPGRLHWYRPEPIAWLNQLIALE